MASLSASHAFSMASLLFLSLVTSLFVFNPASGYQFTVGGPIGWTVPTEGNEPESNYNHWALRTHIHVGDSLYFKYENDSVLLVNHDDYRSCDASNPIVMFTDGNSTFEFDRIGFSYFISGEPGHCSAGQRMIVRVMAWTEGMNPSGAPVSTPGPESSPSSHHHSSTAFRYKVGYGAFVGLLVMVVIFAR